MKAAPIAVVTGGAGFIGSHMVDLLLDRGASQDLALANGPTALSIAVGVSAQRTGRLSAATLGLIN